MEYEGKIWKTICLWFLGILKGERLLEDDIIRGFPKRRRNMAKRVLERAVHEGVILKNGPFYTMPDLYRNILVQYLKKNSSCCPRDLLKDAEYILFKNETEVTCRVHKEREAVIFNNLGAYCIPCWTDITYNR